MLANVWAGEVALVLAYVVTSMLAAVLVIVVAIKLGSQKPDLQRSLKVYKELK